MNIDDYKCRVRPLEKLGCSGCNEEVYTCDVCKEYLMMDCFCGCIPDGRHLCEGCFEEWWEEYSSDLNQKQEIKNDPTA